MGDSTLWPLNETKIVAPSGMIGDVPVIGDQSRLDRNRARIDSPPYCASLSAR